MHHKIGVWFIGCLAVAATVTSEGLNAAIAFTTSNHNDLLLGLRILLFVAFGLNLISIASLIYFTALYVPSVATQRLGLRHTIWIMFSVGLGIATATVAVSGVALVWLLLQQSNLPKQLFGSSAMAWVVAWYSGWGASLALQIVLFAILGHWTRKELKTQSISRLNLDFGIRLPRTGEEEANDSRRSLASRETTLVSPPRSPLSQTASSTRYSSSIKGASGNSRTKLVLKMTPRSSLDMPSIFNTASTLPNVEVVSVESLLEPWNRTSQHRRSASAPGIALPLSRSGLEPIPGSRSESAASSDENEGLTIILSSPPQAISSDTAVVLDYSSSPSTYKSHSSTFSQPRHPSQNHTPSSPPSSPPNFSRPTSRQRDIKPASVSSKRNSFSTSPLQELIHPLFRSTSPHPPPIAIMGSMVTASPMANNPITPNTLARLRTNLFSDRVRNRSPPAVPRIDTSAVAAAHATLQTTTAPDMRSQSNLSMNDRSDPTIAVAVDSTTSQEPAIPCATDNGPVADKSGHWRAMPSIDQPSYHGRADTGKSAIVDPGSPGPSIVDDEELPPILPGFVLSAGKRTSLMGYQERTSKRADKKRGSSRLSFL